jgi:predicted  nucleic acid-binding Zn-ribbon protein
MDDEMRAAFARIDRWFELSQAQHSELRQEVGGLGQRLAGVEQEVGGLRQEVGGLGRRLDGVEREITALRHEFHRFRDWVTARFAEVRLALEDLAGRIERLERLHDEQVG